MARTKGVNKSQVVREYLEANPDAKAKEVVKGLAKNKIKVTQSLVYSVIGGMKEKKRRKARVVKAARAATNVATSNGAVSHGAASKHADALTMIREVKAMAVMAGGFEKLKELVDALAE